MTLYEIKKATTKELNEEFERLEAKKARLMLPGENWILATVETEMNDIKNELDKKGVTM